MNLHVYTANTTFGVFNIAVEASDDSRFDAISVAQSEFGGVTARVGSEAKKARKLPDAAFDATHAKGWAWLWRA